MDITRGDIVTVVDAFGARRERRALTPPVRGHDFEVVWVCSEQEWNDAVREGREPEGVPWPAEDVLTPTTTG